MTGNKFRIPVTSQQKLEAIVKYLHDIEENFKGYETTQTYLKHQQEIKMLITDKDSLADIVLKTIYDYVKLNVEITDNHHEGEGSQARLEEMDNWIL